MRRLEDFLEALHLVRGERGARALPALRVLPADRCTKCKTCDQHSAKVSYVVRFLGHITRKPFHGILFRSKIVSELYAKRFFLKLRMKLSSENLPSFDFLCIFSQI